jgi:phosphoribosylamine--glycine ligase
MAHRRNILVISHFGVSGELCHRFLGEGNPVKFYIKDPHSRDINDGLITKVNAWEPHVAWADLIIFDDATFGKVADGLRQMGKAVVGPCPYSDRLEMDRGFGAEEMKKAGMTVLPDWNFRSIKDAVAFVQKNPGRYVIKPSGKAQDEKALTYVGKSEDGSDIVAMLENYQKKWGSKIHEIQVQTFAKGVEVAVGAWFNGKEAISPCFVNFEYKKMMNNDLGPNTGEMGTTGFWTDHCRLYDETLGKMVAAVRASGYSGYLDINCIATKDAVYPLEFTPRFGVPTIWLQMEGIKSPLGDFFDALGSGKKFRLDTESGVQICVVIATAPFPYEDPESFKKYSADKELEFKDPSLGGIYLADVKKIDNRYMLAGNSGYACVCVGKGMTYEEAKDDVYQKVKSVSLADAFYRTDIGHKWHKDRDLLSAWGWL